MHVFVVLYKRRDQPELISQERVGPPPGRGMASAPQVAQTERL